MQVSFGSMHSKIIMYDAYRCASISIGVYVRNGDGAASDWIE